MNGFIFTFTKCFAMFVSPVTSKSVKAEADQQILQLFASRLEWKDGYETYSIETTKLNKTANKNASWVNKIYYELTKY